MRHPNKRFQIKQADREECSFESLKHIWTVHKLLKNNYGVGLPIINGHQMLWTEKKVLDKKHLASLVWTRM